MNSSPLSRYHSVKENEFNLSKKREIRERIENVLKNGINNNGSFCLVPFGSTVTGFGLKNSDLDLVLLLSKESRKFQTFTRMDMLQILRGCLNILKNQSCFSQFNLIEATVPVLAFNYVPYFIKIELTCSDGNCISEGIRNSHLLSCYSQSDQRVSQLAVLVKYWAEHHNLMSARYNRLNGYSLVLMTVFFLQNSNPPLLPCLQKKYPYQFNNDMKVTYDFQYIFTDDQRKIIKQGLFEQNKSDLFSLLAEFFKFYSNFDFTRVISVRTGRVLSIYDCDIRDSNRREWNACIRVEDPIYRYNVTKQVWKSDIWREILEVFKKTHRLLDNQRSLGYTNNFDFIFF